MVETEKILSIKEIEDFSFLQVEYNGYKITTSKADYYLLIANGQHCCESFGYFSTNDNIKEFIGSDLISLKTVELDPEQKETILKSRGFGYYYYDDEENYQYVNDDTNVQFVNIETSNGLLQLAVYNSHNGYYGHNIVVLKVDEKNVLDSGRL